MEPELAIALSARDWPDRLRRFLADHGGARVRVAAMGPEDLLAESYDVLLIDDICSFLTPRLVDLLVAKGRVVLGVYDPVEFSDGKERLRECGVADVIEADAHPDEYLAVISRAMVGRVQTHDHVESVDPVAVDAPVRPSVIAVGGPSGGSGATEVTIALAQALGHRGRTVVVDADDHAPSVAQRLGLALYPNLRTAIDVLEHRTGALDRVLHLLPGDPFRVLPGLANVRDWSEIRPRLVLDVIRELSLRCDHVVVNVGSQLEAETYGDGAGRFGMSRALVDSADRLVAVGNASPVGVSRLLQWLSEVDTIRGGRRADVLVNRAPSDHFRRGELLEEITRTYEPLSFAYLPDDPRITAAAWDGVLPSKGRFAKNLARWVDVFVAEAPA
jgi:MinD-like ATPase involved in chromosome partitioning or flagellar assembly